MFKNKKMLFVVVAIIIVLCILVVSINIYNQKKKEQFIKSETERVQQYDKITDFKNIEEVFYYLETELLSSEASSIENVDYQIKANLKYNAEYEYRNYYEKLIQYSAYVLNYKNFYITDNNKNINIFVLCNSDKKTVSTYYINDQENYFEKQNSQKNVKEYSQIAETKVQIKSKELNEIISNNWSVNQINLGKQDSYFRNYDIFFDEGFEVRKVNGKVFNIVFTEKYTNEIVNNIKVGTNKSEIEKTLGKPTFDTENVWGYKTEKFYIFFSSNQISVYPTISYETGKIVDIIDNYKSNQDFQTYINNIRNTWQDYDYYESNGNKVIIKYTLKGITFKYDSSAQNGIILYNNYNGKVNKDDTLEEVINADKNLPDKMYFENSNSVFEHEKIRIETLDDATEYGNFANGNVLNISSKYKVVQNPNKNAMFISINKQAPNTELRESIYYGIWYDDNNFIYSIKGKGIYMYNVVNQTYTTVVEGNDDYRIYELLDNNTLYYDKTHISVSK